MGKYKGLRHLLGRPDSGPDVDAAVDALDGFSFETTIGRVSFDEDKHGAIGMKAEMRGDVPIFQPLMADSPWVFVEPEKLGVCIPGLRYRVTFERIGGE